VENANFEPAEWQVSLGERMKGCRISRTDGSSGILFVPVFGDEIYFGSEA
jgi:hypothetical protein